MFREAEMMPARLNVMIGHSAPSLSGIVTLSRAICGENVWLVRQATATTASYSASTSLSVKPTQASLAG
jgi:hypothetical protein